MTEIQNSKRVEIITLLIFSFAIIFISSCAQNASHLLPAAADYESPPPVEKKDLKMGVVSGPYGDMFMDAIEPILKDKGYSVELVYYEDYVQPNIALANSEIDMNMFQHYKYLNSCKSEHDLALSSITEIPTAPMGIFSLKYNSLQLPDSGGITVVIPADNANLSRALQLLEITGLIGIDKLVDKSKATVDDISKNPYGIQFILKNARDLVASLEDYDLSVINGNYALSGGLNLADALHTETLVEGYINVIAVRTDDLSSQFVADIVDVVYSETYRQKILQNDMYKGFQLPRNFYDNREWEDRE